jgi:chromosome segregation ATPase
MSGCSNCAAAAQAAQVTIEERLEAYPHLKQRIEALLNVVENAAQDLERADEAEQRVIEELRQIGQQALQAWAQTQQQQQSVQLRYHQPAVRQHRKKNSTGTAATGG